MSKTEIIIFGTIWGIQAIGWAIWFVVDTVRQETVTLEDVVGSIGAWVLCGFVSLCLLFGVFTFVSTVIAVIFWALETDLAKKILNLKIKG